VPAGLSRRHAKEFEMRPKSELHRHVANTPATGVSLLRLSVPARLLVVAFAAALLWIAVIWALR
jgi:hypothetical protein